MLNQPKALVFAADGQLKGELPDNYVLQPGESIRTSLSLMDTQAVMRDAKSEAMAEMMRRNSTFWATPGMNVPPSRPAGRSPLAWVPRETTQAELGAAAAAKFAAHESMKELNSNAWKPKPMPPKRAA